MHQNIFNASHHVDELRYGQAELDDDHVGDVWHGPRPLVVAAEQLLEEIILGVRVGLAVTKNCRRKRRHVHCQRRSHIVTFQPGDFVFGDIDRRQRRD